MSDGRAIRMISIEQGPKMQILRLDGCFLLCHISMGTSMLRR